MAPVSDRAALRAILKQDPRWNLYALGDLAPGYFERCQWRASGSAVLLLYRAVTPPVLFATGEPDAVAPLLDRIDEQAVYLHVRPRIADLIAPRCATIDVRPMWRMALEPSAFRPESGAAPAERLGAADAGAIERLYADGAATGESPDFFFAPMVEAGVFYGVREQGELIAVAGTHLAEPSEGVAAIGNVYTRRDRRGRGLAGALTSAVTCELLRLGVETVGLNVIQKNTAAVRVYERLGFERYCDFVEGVAAFT
ncbi:MAG: GNAT family N-acetyltransferase [Acidobacteriota bacterium]